MSRSQPGKVGEEVLMPSPSETWTRASVLLSPGLMWKPGPESRGSLVSVPQAAGQGQSCPPRLATHGLQFLPHKQSKAQYMQGDPRITIAATMQGKNRGRVSAFPLLPKLIQILSTQNQQSD